MVWGGEKCGPVGLCPNQQSGRLQPWAGKRVGVEENNWFPASGATWRTGLGQEGHGGSGE